MSRFVSEPLGKHDRSTFASGNERIDTYFKQTVSQDVKRNYAVCYVLVERESARLAGFYTLSSHGIALSDLATEWAKKRPRYPSVPAALIGWLGRDLSFRGQSVGSMLIYVAIARLAASSAGVHAVCADAIDADAAAFYKAHQFEAFLSRPQRFYLPMKTALALVNEPANGCA